MIKSFLIPLCFWISKKAEKKKPAKKAAKKEDLKKNLDEKEYCFYTKWAGGTEKKLKSKLNNILSENDEIIIILKKHIENMD